jgi:poly(hydroxyalkanoate) depolymerase family esterase
MNAPMNSAMLEAMRLTRAGQLLEATALIQRALNGGHGSEPAARSTRQTGTPIEHDVVLVDAEPTGRSTTRKPESATDADFIIIDAEPDAATKSKHESQRDPQQEPQRHSTTGGTARTQGRPAWPRFDSAALREQWQPLRGPLREPLAKRAPAPLPEGAQFLSASYANQAGTRSYKLYVPSGYRGEPLPLVVMLHGCTQDPDDFAAGTKMNELAEKRGCLVLYPAQTSSANGSKCWNWFKASDQQRDRGEPSIIAGMTRQVCDTHAVDARRIYVAGLSAGGAMAVTMALGHPELYAAVGIHSGLPHAVARDLPSALAAMQQGRSASTGGAAPPLSGAAPVAAIVFHGDRDTTVHPGNGDQVIAQCMPSSASQRAQAAPEPRVSVQHGQVPQGHAYTRTVYSRMDGQSIAEHWLIHGAGHAWSGGSARGSYTDPKGPDAAEHMLRFFLEHPRPDAAA